MHHDASEVLKKANRGHLFQSDLRVSHGSRTAQVCYNGNKINDFSSIFI